MTIAVKISKDSIINDENIYFTIENQRILINSLENGCIINNLAPGNYHFSIYTKSCKKAISYICLWIINLIITPFNILLMNTSSEWYNSLVPTSVSCGSFIKLTNNTEILIKIYSSNIKSGIIKRYKVEFITDSQIKKTTYHEQLNRQAVCWAMNKYLSKFFSYCIWCISVLNLIFISSSSSIKWYLIIFTTIMFLALFLCVLIYSLKKFMKVSNEIKCFLSNSNKRN